ncbi:hypothetical protein VE03_04787 [Pseudogymnoascus sp. 23342-1-I1]|nr:hypothetical protein VE03_04787 [Pseudogymnoascus sp. 23342-1-I1]
MPTGKFISILTMWATIPVVRDAQAEAVVNFPPELDMPWKFLQRIYGCTADSGNNAANVLHNFDKNGRWTLWINNGVSEKIRSTELGFFKVFYEVEVKALPVYLEIIRSIVAYDAGDIEACSWHLRNMSPLLRELFQEFYQGITSDKVSKDLWLRYCQGFQGWGVGSEVAGQFVRYNGSSELPTDRVMPYLKVPAPERYCMTAGKPVASGEGVEGVDGALQPLEDLLVARLRETV